MKTIQEIRQERSRSFEPILRKIIRARNPHNVVEWGPGYSTQVMSEEMGGGFIITMEHDPKYFNRQAENLKELGFEVVDNEKPGAGKRQFGKAF